jgi:hypothetical protein
VTDADEKLKRLYRLVEDGMTDLDEVLKDRLNTLKSERDRASAALDRARPTAGPPIKIDPALIEQFGRTMRENFTTGSVPFRKAYLQSLIDIIEVIRAFGPSSSITIKFCLQRRSSPWRVTPSTMSKNVCAAGSSECGTLPAMTT